MTRAITHAMHLALEAWPQRQQQGSQGAQIAAHALAHSVSASGLYRALLAAGHIAKRVRAQQAN